MAKAARRSERPTTSLLSALSTPRPRAHTLLPFRKKMATADRALDGWLHKLAKPKRSGAPAAPMWQRRWFTLLGDTLSFYNTEQDVAQKLPPKWTLDLAASGAVVSPFSEPGAPPDATRIELTTGGGEHFSLRAESEFEAEMWAEALRTPARVRRRSARQST